MSLDERTLRLIAVGASISANCQLCLQINVEKAIQAGIQEQDIAKAIQIGKMVRQGAASKMDRLVDGLTFASPPHENAENIGCDCGA
jgi:AhpD family alkylhydroperoxidase